jgi:A/G-specific adenine glycosylase
MDLGATICLARAPRCPVCPVQGWCSARAAWFAADAVQLPLTHDGGPYAGAEGQAGGPARLLVADGRAAYAARSNGAVPARPSRAGRAQARSVKSERFEGSRRWYRGRIVDVLRRLPAGAGMDLASLGREIRPDFHAGQLPWLQELVQALARDGLIEVAEGEGGATVVALPGEQRPAKPAGPAPSPAEPSPWPSPGETEGSAGRA